MRSQSQTPARDAARGRRSRVRRLAADERAATLVEFAILLPVLVALLVGVFEFALFFTARMAIESAVAEAARLGITGRTLGTASREEAIKAVLAARAGTFVDPARLEFETLVYPDFSSIGQPEPWDDRNGNGVRDPGESYRDVNGNGQWDADMGRPGAGGPDEVVLYRARYRWRFVTPLVGAFFPPEGAITIAAATAVRNEPFPTE